MPYTIEFGQTNLEASSFLPAEVAAGVPRFLWPKVTQWERSAGSSSWIKITNSADNIFKSVFPAFRISNTGNSQIIISSVEISALLCVPRDGYSYPVYVPMVGLLARSYVFGKPETTKINLYLGSETEPISTALLTQALPDNETRDYSVEPTSLDDTLYYWKPRASTKNGTPNPDGTPSYLELSFGNRSLVLEAGSSILFRIDLDCPEFEEGPSVLGTGYANCYQGSVMQWYPENSIKVRYEGGIDPEPEPGPTPDPQDIPKPSECFDTSFVRLIQTGGSVFEFPVDRFLFSDEEISPDIYGPVTTSDLGCNRPWIKVKNTTASRKAIKDIYIAVIQGTAYPTEGTLDYGVALYDYMKNSHISKIYTPTGSYTGTLEVRLKDGLSCRGSVDLPLTPRSKLNRSSYVDQSFWKNRPSGPDGKLYPDTGQQADVTYYHIELSKETILESGKSIYFEVTCSWDSPLPVQPVPEFPLPTGWTARWGYILQWYTKNSCRVKMYDADDPGPDPDPEPITSPYLSYEIGHGRDNAWAAGLDRVLLNHGGSSPYWDRELLPGQVNNDLPSIKFTNTTSRTVYIPYVNIKCVNGITWQGSSSQSGLGINFKDESGKGKAVGSYTATLYGNVRPRTEGGVVEHTASAILSPVSSNLNRPLDEQGSPKPDAAYWAPRPVDENGEPLPDKNLYPGVDPTSADLVFNKAIVLKPNETFFLDLSAVWWNSESEEGVRHCIQLYHIEKDKSKSRIVTAPMAVQFTWDGNGGFFDDSDSVAYTYPVIGSTMLPNDYPIPTREDYLFLGWDKPLPINQEIDRSMSFKAIWLKVSGGCFHCMGKDTDTGVSRWYQSIPWYTYAARTGEWTENRKAKKMSDGVWVDFPESEP